MTVSLKERVAQLLKETELPKGSALIDEAHKIASEIKIGRTKFMEKYDVSSELEYKRRCIKEGRIMYHAHIGMNTWAETADALQAVYKFACDNNFRIDRAGICLDRRMSLPVEMRKSAPQETGPYLETDRDWHEVGQAAPIQPHMGDFIIGFPASVTNAVAALKAGVTTVGNMSQYYAHEAPMWKRTDITAIETVKAIGIMGALRDKGTLMHSYLDDGFGALFLDCSTTAAWAYWDRYIIEDLLGAKVAHCVGGLVSDPVKRAGWVFALDEIHDHDCIGSMFYGDTISSNVDPEKNRSLSAEYIIWDILAQLECPTGHALMVVPFTEALRAPSTEEICEIQLWAREMEVIARRMQPHFNMSASREFARTVCTKGKKIFRDSLDYFADCGVDVKDPLQLVYLLKKIGPVAFENEFNAAARDERVAEQEGRPVPNDIFTRTLNQINIWTPEFEKKETRELLSGRKILLASTDVHEHGILMIDSLLRTAGADVTNIGAERNPDEVVSEAAKHKCELVFVSTHNGMALQYAKNVYDEMEEENYHVPLCMGGVLNQNVEESTIPVDVTADLERIGVTVVSDLTLLPKRAHDAYISHKK